MSGGKTKGLLFLMFNCPLKVLGGMLLLLKELNTSYTASQLIQMGAKASKTKNPGNVLT